MVVDNRHLEFLVELITWVKMCRLHLCRYSRKSTWQNIIDTRSKSEMVSYAITKSV